MRHQADAADKPIAVVEYLLLLLLATLWGASFSLLKLAVGTIPPFTTIALRTAIAGVLLLALMRWQGVRLPTDRQSLRSYLVVSIVNTVAPFMLIAWSLQWVDAGLAVILNSTTPIFAFLITFVMIGLGGNLSAGRYETITPRKLFGVAAGLAGIVLIIGAEALGGLGRQFVPQLAIVLSSVSYAMSAIYGRTFRNMSPMAPAAGSLLIGTALLTPLALVVEHPWTARPSTTSIVALIVLGVASTALGNVLYFRLLGTLGSLGTTAQSYLRVSIGVLAGILLLDEQLTALAGVGLICVVVGVAAMTFTGPLQPIVPWLGKARDAARLAITRRSPLALEYALLLLIATLWAGSYVWVKIGLHSIPPLTLMAGRIGTAALFLLTILWVQGKSIPRDRGSWRMFATQGLLASVLPFSLVAWGQQWVDAGPAAILNSVSPVFAFLITWGVTRHEPATALKLFGVIAGLAGVAVVIGPPKGGTGGTSGIGSNVLPQLAIVLSSLSYAAAAIYSRNFKGADAVVTAAGSMLAASMMILPVALIVDRPWTLAPTASGLIAIVGLGVMSTGLGFIIYFRLSRTLGPLAVTAQSYLRAPIGVGLGALLLGEVIPVSAIFGLLMVVVGVGAMTLPPAAAALIAQRIGLEAVVRTVRSRLGR